MPKYFFSSIFAVPSPLFSCLVLLLQGCASPSERFLDTAKELGFVQQEVEGLPYQHRLFLNSQARDSNNIDELHVYLDGDGTPWKSEIRVASDPTARNHLILKMMAKDRAPAILLGRPCYYGLNLSHFCNNRLWTSARYSKDVVDSMKSALKHWISTKNIKRLALVGFSGGGTLATLLASDLERIETIVTIAANLDVTAWSKHHGYLYLTASMNPMTDARIPPTIRQIHLAGLKDENVPSDIIEAFSRTQRNAVYLPQAEYDHSCCWPDIWPSILATYLNNDKD